MEEAKLGELTGTATAEYRNQPGGEKLICGLFEGDGAILKTMAEARAPLRFEGVARDHARRYRTVVTVFITFFDGRSKVVFRAAGEPEVYSLID